MTSLNQRGKLEGFLSGVWLTAAVNILGVAAGYLGSHFDKEIGEAWSAIGNGVVKLGLGVIAFLVVSALFGLLFSGLTWAQQKGGERFARRMEGSSDAIEKNTQDLKAGSKRMEELTTSIEEKTKELKDRAQVIDDRVRQLYTLPPQGFLVAYSSAIQGITESFSATRIEVALPRERTSEAIRTQLLYAMGLATSFDSDSNSARYGCNVMLYRDSSTLGEKDRESLQSHLRFIERGVDVRQLAGVLETVTELSVSTESRNGPDQNLPLICLPIPKFSADERKNRVMVGVLPGAADAFVRRTEAVIETPEDWLNKTNTTAFSDYVKDDMRRFAAKEMKAIQSFISIPLLAPGSMSSATGEDEVMPFAVLNIHRSTPNPLLAEKLELFAPLISLSAEVIAREVWRYLGRATDILDDNFAGGSNGPVKPSSDPGAGSSPP